MTIIVFLIDTSASMNQRACLGGRPTLLDVAKGAVETFVKVRQRSPESRGDRYMLMTFEDPPNNIKAGWKENISIFMNELKNLTCLGLTTLGAALKHAFDVLNINRMQTGIDTYGQGRCPFFLEPSVIVVITDGGKLSTMTGVQEDFNLPMHSPIPGSELTREPFRWDQRLFSLVLRLSGTPAMDRDTGLVPSDTSPIDAMCEVTGGRSYCITSQRMLLQCVDSLVLKVQSGVVINLEKIGPDPPPINNNSSDGGKTDGTTDGDDVDKDSNDVDGNRSNVLTSTAWHNCRRLIYVPRAGNQKGYAVGFWPIPESFWPDATATSLPPRSAHPNMKFTCTSQEPMVIDNLPFDKYELEPSPLTQYILARKQPTVCWQVFVPNSYKNSDVRHPFGYLKASTNLTCVNLFVMPYNYPALLPLIDELFKVHRSKPTLEWRAQFQNYLRTMPAYYALPLRRALTRMGSPGNLPQTLVPETLDNSLNYGVVNYLKRVKTQAKTEHDKLCNEVSSKTAKVNLGNEGIRVVSRSPLKKDLVSHPLLQDKFNHLRDQLSDFNGFQAGLDRGATVHGVHNYRNAFDTPRRALLDQVVRMRANFLQTNLDHTKVVDEDWKHSMPVCQMGNYQEHLKRMQPQLREIESTPVRQHMFGNPFKIEKSMMVDEADMDMVAGGSSGGGSSPRSSSKRGQPGRGGSATSLDGRGPPSKRKPGPIPRDLHVRRPTSPRPGTPILTATLSPPPSPGNTPPASPTLLPGATPSPAFPPVTSQPGTPVGSAVTPVSTPSVSPLNLQNNLLNIQPASPVVQPSVLLGTMLGTMSGSLGGPVAGAAAVMAPTAPVSVTAAMADGGAIPPEVTPMDVDVLKGGEVPNNVHTNGPVFIDGQSAFVKEEISHLPNVPQFAENASSVEAISATLGAVSGDVATHMNTGQNSILMKRELAKIKRHNLNIRAAAYKEVRRPGKNVSALLETLQGLRGGPEVKAVILQQVIEESLRFKRRQLATLVQQVLSSVESNATSSATASLVNNNHNSAS